MEQNVENRPDLTPFICNPEYGTLNENLGNLYITLQSPYDVTYGPYVPPMYLL